MKAHRLADGYQCYRKMMEDGAIYFSAVLHPAAGKVRIIPQNDYGIEILSQETGITTNTIFNDPRNNRR